jgi:hypothetical protein
MSLGFESPAFFDEALENAAKGLVLQRARVVAKNVHDDLLLTGAVEHRQSAFGLDLPNTKHASRALAQQIQDLLVDGVNSGAPIFDGLL